MHTSQNPDRKKLRILLVEDDPQLTADLNTYVKTLEDTELVGSTNSSYEAIDMIRSLKPDALILDLELHNGSGNGLLLLGDMRCLPAGSRPYTLITTNNSSATTFDLARQLGADMIMSKHQADYTAKSPVDFLRVIRSSLNNRITAGTPETPDTPSKEETEKAREKQIRDQISRELDALGFSNKVLGYQYLIDAICLACSDSSLNIIQELARRYKKTAPSVERAMQNAIERTWNTSPLETLVAHYTAHINPDRGMPTIMEFVSFFARKIRNTHPL